MVIDIVVYMLMIFLLLILYMEDFEIFFGDMVDKICKGYVKEWWMFLFEKIWEWFYDEMIWGWEFFWEDVWDYNVKNDFFYGFFLEVIELIDDYFEWERDYEEEYGMFLEGVKGVFKVCIYYDLVMVIMERIGDIILGCGFDCEDMVIYSVVLVVWIFNYWFIVEIVKSDEEKIVVCLK